jgi:hypothetical protein
LLTKQNGEILNIFRIIEMGVANRDASQLTAQRRNKAQNSYYTSWKGAVQAGNASALTSPARIGAEMISEIRLGCTQCFIENNSDPNQPRYPNNFSSGKNTGTS